MAAEQYTRALGLAPNDSDLWRFRAIAHLAAGNEKGYQDARQTMVEWFADTTNGIAALNVVEVCVCRPDAIEDWQRLVPFARIGLGAHQDSERFLGAALYRAGNYEAALESYRRVEELFPLNAFDLFFVAMAHQRLGQIEDAHRRFDQAEQWIKEANEWATRNVSSFEHPHWGAWVERPETFAVQREANALINTNH